MAYISVLKLHPLFFRCHKILPLVYDESLSYYEVLCKVAKSVNEVIESTNQLNDNVTDLNSRTNQLTDKVNEIAEEINGFEAEINGKFDELVIRIEAELGEKFDDYDRQFAELKAETQADIVDLQDQMNTFLTDTFPALQSELVNLIDAELADLDLRFEELSADLQEYIRVKIQEVIDSIPHITTVTIIDPTTGELTEIQNVIWNIYNWIVTDKLLNCEQLDSLELTAYEIDNYEVNGVMRGLTAFEWDSDTKRIFGWVDDSEKVKSYKDGNPVTLDKNVDFNNCLLRYSGCYTANEWEDCGVTVDIMDESGFTAWDYDWKSNYLIA